MDMILANLTRHGKELGVSAAVIRKLYERYGSFDVDRALTLLWYETRTRTILHPSGWLCHAIEHHYRTRNIPHTGRQQRRESNVKYTGKEGAHHDRN